MMFYDFYINHQIFLLKLKLAIMEAEIREENQKKVRELML